MKIYLQKAIFINRAPFDKLELDFYENEISVLSAVNGKGKTTILSHLVDAFHEIARPHFQNEYEGKENKFYRVSSAIHNLDKSKPSFVYLRFNLGEETFDYLDIRNNCTEEEYNNAISIDEKIPFNQVQNDLKNENYIKKVSSNFNKEKAEKIFRNNLITYFPAYRYEQPGYLNDPYKIKLNFKKESGFSGYLPNPIEVLSGLPQLANWIMDLVLDNQYLNVKTEDIEKSLESINIQEPIQKNQLSNLINSIIQINIHLKSHIREKTNFIITEILKSKGFNTSRFGIGERNLGGTRVQIVNAEDGLQIYPTIFNLSSGEASLLCVFGELLRQADTNKNNILLDEITGIVLIDEVDKHLHIKLQKEVLPKLFKLFKNVQFIVSSHSPFLSMGLAEELQERSKIIDLDNLGISTDPTTNDLYKEVYEMMVGENERFKEKYELLETKIKEGSKPLIITEGKTDRQHIEKAKEKLNITNLDVDFYKITEDWSDSHLKKLLEQLSKVPQSREIIGIFDRDVPEIINDIEKDNQSFKKYGNNVFAFCIPLKNGEFYGDKISIEHYYPKSILKKENLEGRRLFLGSEFYKSGNSTEGNYQTKIEQIQNKVDINGVIDKKVYKKEDLEQSTSVALSKSDFAQLIETDSGFIEDFDFNTFEDIFNKIREIINPSSEESE
nr:AAA family ATPase [Candidatus Gracilibacteria bacterium]